MLGSGELSCSPELPIIKVYRKHDSYGFTTITFGVSGSRSARRVMDEPSKSSIALLHDLKSLFLTATLAEPACTLKVEGVLPTNLPFTSMSAPAGSELIARG